MVDLDEQQRTEGLSRKDAMPIVKEIFKDDKLQAAILFKLMNRKVDHLEWLYNTSAFFGPDGDVFFFDTSLQNGTEKIYHLAGETGPEVYDFETYTKVFKN